MIRSTRCIRRKGKQQEFTQLGTAGMEPDGSYCYVDLLLCYFVIVHVLVFVLSRNKYKYYYNTLVCFIMHN